MPDERILIADDEADVLDMCIRALSIEGYQVCGAHNGFEAIEIVKGRDSTSCLRTLRCRG